MENEFIYHTISYKGESFVVFVDYKFEELQIPTNFNAVFAFYLVNRTLKHS